MLTSANEVLMLILKVCFWKYCNRIKVSSSRKEAETLVKEVSNWEMSQFIKQIIKENNANERQKEIHKMRKAKMFNVLMNSFLSRPY